MKPGQYTLNVTDKSSTYAPFSTSFALTTDNVVAVYNNNAKAPALVAAKDVQADDFTNFVKNIQKVSVNGKEYAASGKGAVKLINADGTLVTTADALKAEGTYNIVVTATGYNKTLEFTYTNKSDTTATKPSDATTATKPAATTTATKPAVKPVKKVTVKKQTAKVKAGKKKLTVTIQDSLIANVDPDNHRVAKANESYYLLKKTPTPTVIVECGFLSNPTEADLLLTDDYQNKLVNAIYIGIQNYLSESM